MSGQTTTGARETYDAFAATYDGFNYRYQYERWTRRLLGQARVGGLKGDRLLDVGCGTGLSFLVPLADGWSVCGCDISPAMIERARARVGDEVELHLADMRALPRFGEFDLVWGVNDALNYLMDGAELQAALAGMRRNLAFGGVIVFDLNTLATYRGFFSEEVVVERDGCRYIWQGLGTRGEPVAGSIFESQVDGEGPGVQAHVHRQRHLPEAEVAAALAGAGLRCVGLWGEIDGELEPGLEESRHTKAVYVCRAENG